MTKRFLVNNWPQGSKQSSRCAGGRLEFNLGQNLLLTKNMGSQNKAAEVIRQQRHK